MNVHDRIKELRLSFGISQKELAEELNRIEIDKNDPKIFTQTISYWENGRDPNLTGLRKLARYFNCSVDFLLDESEITNWSEFSTLAELSAKPVEAFADFLKKTFDEETAMAILDSFKILMMHFTTLRTLKEEDLFDWDTELADTINQLPILVQFSQAIRRFQFSVAYNVNRQSGDDIFPIETNAFRIVESFTELQNSASQLTQKVLTQSMRHPGLISLDLFLSEKELKVRWEKKLEEIKTSDPENYQVLIRTNDLISAHGEAEEFKDCVNEEFEERKKESKLKYRDK